MESNYDPWTKEEIKTYLLLLCARADGQEAAEEIDFIKSSSDKIIFNKMYEIFKADSEKKAIKKLGKAINNHVYGDMEIAALRKEMLDVFRADKNFSAKEKYLDQVLDHIIY